MNINLNSPSDFQHELRSPLTAIMGMAAFLSNTDLNATQRELVDNISQSAKSLLLLANDLSTAPQTTRGQGPQNLTQSQNPPMQSAQKTSPRVLVVEDSDLIQFIHKKMLLELHCHVDAVSTATEALAITQNTQYDLILLDIGLPDKSGIEVALELRQREQNTKPGLPTFIVALTAFVEHTIQNECLKAGINQILNKPIDIENLRAVLSLQSCQPPTPHILTDLRA